MSNEDIDFTPLHLPISTYVKIYPKELQQDIFEYLTTLSDIERNAYLIAFQHLGESFNVPRSNGFKSWKSSKSNSK